MKSLRSKISTYKRTPEFTCDTVADGVLRAHSTFEGVLGRIFVLEGRLGYCILEPEVETLVLCPGEAGAVEPIMRHALEPLGDVRFYVEFCR